MIILLTTIFILSFFLFIFYIKISVKFKLIDRPNDLSVHKNNMPTGAGIIFLIIFYFFLIFGKFFIPVDLFLLQKNLIILIISLTYLNTKISFNFFLLITNIWFFSNFLINFLKGLYYL